MVPNPVWQNFNLELEETTAKQLEREGTEKWGPTDTQALMTIVILISG